MALDPVTGLTRSEEIMIEQSLKSYFSKNNIGTTLSAFYASYARTIYKKTEAEAQEILNNWKTRGLNQIHLVNIARDVCNKNLV